MKKLFTALFVLALTLTAVSCDFKSKDTTATTGADSTAVSTDTVTVATDSTKTTTVTTDSVTAVKK